MKVLTFFLIILILFSLIYQTGCKKDEEDSPLSYIEAYTVNLTEPKGTTYAGNFFPLEEGYTCYYSGSVDMLTEMTIPGYDPIEESIIAPALGMLKVLQIRDIPLNSGLITLYPVVDLSDIDGQITADTSRFFDKDAEAVYVKALKLADGSYLEVKDPVYIKSSLVVGESWRTAPQMDMTELLAGELNEGIESSDMTLNAEAKFFVVGHEMISLPIGSRWAMRMEQANDITMKGKCPLTMRMSLEGQTITIKITINKSELNLTSLGENGIAKINDFSSTDPTIDMQKLHFIESHFNGQLLKISRVLAKTLIHRFKL
jgi:hypothetical protein